MIQRKQSVFLLLAFVAIVACLSMPIAEILPHGMGASLAWFNIGLYGESAGQLTLVPFILLALSGIIGLVTIFLYRNRLLQARLCTAALVLCLAWYVYYAFAALNAFQALGAFRPHFAACLPLVAAVLFVMARRGVMADEKLVRSMDRIR